MKAACPALSPACDLRYNNTVICSNDGFVFRRDMYCSGYTSLYSPNCTETGSGPVDPYRPLTYYVNSDTGNDSLDGRSLATAWATLDKVCIRA